MLGVSEKTIHTWKVQHEEFATALVRSKETINAQVEASLVQRALGFEREVEKVSQGRMIKIKEYFPPDVSAIRIWLQNRMPEVYRETKVVQKQAATDDPFLRILERMEERAKIDGPRQRQLLIDRYNALDDAEAG